MRRRAFIATLAAAAGALLLPHTRRARRRRALPPARPASSERLALRGGAGCGASRRAPLDEARVDEIRALS